MAGHCRLIEEYDDIGRHFAAAARCIGRSRGAAQSHSQRLFVTLCLGFGCFSRVECYLLRRTLFFGAPIK